MRAGTRKESVESRGGTSWNDGLDSLDGAGTGNGSSTSSQGSGSGSGGSGRGDDGGISQASWFAPIDDVSDCPGGVCPVPWATKEEPPVILPDNVNHPTHYTDGGGVECIEAIESALTNEEYRGFLKGNVLKYLWRCNLKGKPKEDLQKCEWYLKRLLQTY